MGEASELRAGNGVTPGIYDLLRPWVCALPVNDLSPININTMLPGQAPLLAMLLPGQLRVEQARQMLIRRPANGFSSVAEFWAMLARTGLSPLRSEEHTSELQSLMRISYAVFCLKKKKYTQLL